MRRIQTTTVPLHRRALRQVFGNDDGLHNFQLHAIPLKSFSKLLGQAGFNTNDKRPSVLWRLMLSHACMQNSHLDRASDKDMLRDSGESKQVHPDTNAKVHATKVDCICQLCGEYGHGAMQCKKYPKVKDAVNAGRTPSAIQQRLQEHEDNRL